MHTKKRDILSEKRESGMAPKKREFTPESGNVDTYTILTCDVVTAQPIKDTGVRVPPKEPRSQTRTGCNVERYQTLKHNNTSVSGHPP